MELPGLDLQKHSEKVHGKQTTGLRHFMKNTQAYEHTTMKFFEQEKNKGL
jgi:hypothetical protein